jgi:hypothetical protein
MKPPPVLLELTLTEEEILEDLCWPQLPPGRWHIPVAGRGPADPAVAAEAVPSVRTRERLAALAPGSP